MRGLQLQSVQPFITGQGKRNVVLSASSSKGVTVGVKADPAQFEGGQLPLNTFSSKAPFTGKVLSIKRLGGRNKERDVSEIVIDTGGVRFDEGQVSDSVGNLGTEIVILTHGYWAMLACMRAMQT